MKYRAILLFIIGIFLISPIYAWNFEQLGGGGTGTTVINNFTINSTTVVHNDLDGLQGGVSGEYYHIRAAWYNTLNSDINDWITDTTNSLTNYYTKTEVNAINTSMKNYVDWVNSTNGVGGEGSYDDSWINSTIDSKILTQNNSINNWVNNIFVKISNIIDLVGNWSADKTSYYTSSQIEGILANGSFADTDTFIANYSTFLTHITYDDVMNGTLKDYFDGLYIGIGTETESKWNANYSTFLLNNISITNALNTKLGISQWNATNTSYALLTELNNGSYLNVDTNIGNWTADKSSYTLLSVLNNGSYLNPEGTDTFIGNYSTFLTHITYGDVMNGTLKTYFDGFYPLITTLIDRLGNWSADKSDYYTSSQVDDVNTSMQNYVNTQNTSVTNALNTKLGISQWNATNTSYYLASNPSGFYSSISNLGNWTADKPSYTLLSVLNNGSYLNYPWNATNTSYALLTELNNGSYLNVDTNIGNWTADKTNYYTKTEVNAINTSMKNYVDWVNSTNGVGGEGSYDDSWINDTIDTKINAGLISYDETKSIEILEWMSQRNISINNYINNTFNTTRNNYVAFVNTSMKNYADTKLSLSGGTMTGNISLGTSGVRLTNGTTNTAVIYHNGTGWIIRG